MKRFPIYRILAAAFAAIVLTACGSNGSGATVPAAGSGVQGALVENAAATKQNFSGEYSGTVKDSYYGKGTATAFYAAYANTVGGVFSAKFAKGGYSTSVSTTVKGTKVKGSTEGGSGSSYCSSTLSGTYNLKTHVLTGSYATVFGCNGEKGTYSLKQQCYFKGGDQVIRPNSALKPC
jgi:hypothetical protein